MERRLTDGEPALGPNPWVRFVRTLAVLAILGATVDFRFLREQTISTRLLVFLGTMVLGILGWCYLEFRNVVIAKSQTTRTFGWKLGALLLHPAFLPIYFIAIPVALILTHAWWNHNHGKTAPAAAPAIEKPLPAHP
jgi:hypothetical protein